MKERDCSACQEFQTFSREEDMSTQFTGCFWEIEERIQKPSEVTKLNGGIRAESALSNYQKVLKGRSWRNFIKKYNRTKLIKILECAENCRNVEKAVKDVFSGLYLKKLTKDLKFLGNLSGEDHLKWW